MNRRLRNSLCWRWFALLLSAGRLAQATYHAALNFPPLLSKLFRAFCALYVLRLHVARAGAFLSAARTCFASALFVCALSNDAPAGASAWGRCPLFALLVLAGAQRRLRTPSGAALAGTGFPHSRTLRVLARRCFQAGNACWGVWFLSSRPLLLPEWSSYNLG